MGRWGKGRRNENGKYLLRFAQENEMFLCNTAFKHGAGSTATWRCMAKMKRKDGKGKYTVYNQIDFILCRHKHKGALKDAKSNTVTQMQSDHRLVTAQIYNIGRMWDRRKLRGKKRPPQIHTALLKDTEKREEYRKALQQRIATEECESWAEMAEKIKKTGKEILGVRPQYKRRGKHWVNDAEVQRLSKAQMKKAKEGIKPS